MKTCNTCKTEKPVEQFVKSKGYTLNKCRACHSAECKAWRQKQPECNMEGCTKPQQGQGYCIGHYRHMFITGGIQRIKHLPYRGEVTYSGAHQRVHYQKGAASLHPCSHCEKQAEHWALDHTQEKEWAYGPSNTSTLKFSRDVEDFIPLCAKCHAAFDRKKVAA